MTIKERADQSDREGGWGGLLWILCLQFFLAERAAIGFWQGHYSLAENFISDLGARCPIDVSSGCDRWPMLMNGSFALQAILIGGGALLLYGKSDRLAVRLGLAFAVISSPGVLLVGIFPENVAPAVHYGAAAMHFVALTVSAAFFAFGLAREGGKAWPFAVLSLITTITGATGTALLGLHIDFGFGFGVIERLVAYPFPIWLAALGVGYLGSWLPSRRKLHQLKT